ncbi:histone-lysine N-methyltransferase 2C-like, partial [Plectropomus leopardus]|uniref:histone-lysine N-methyltransferase 2C-like n=1 Tax=Plectropomus leopardus TaxID=160734 RepID=UPI001C4D91A7
ESQRRQYEEWLGETQQLLQIQQRLLEDQIAAHRKTKKSLSAKQRTAKKAGRALAEEDAAQLRNITEQQGAVQKQLEQIRKQQKDHAELIEDYRTKQQQRAAAGGAFSVGTKLSLKFEYESQRRQYEEWLGETQQLLQIQQRLLEDQIAAHRKTKKSLSAKQRTAKKAGRALAEEDAAQLRNITEQQGAVQKQLEQ